MLGLPFTVYYPETDFSSVLLFFFSSCRSPTSQVLLIQVGTPNFGSMNFMTTNQMARKISMPNPLFMSLFPVRLQDFPLTVRLALQ